MDFAAPQYVQVDGHRLAYDEVGPDDPRATVLLLCGIGAKRQGWYWLTGKTAGVFALRERALIGAQVGGAIPANCLASATQRAESCSRTMASFSASIEPSAWIASTA